MDELRSQLHEGQVFDHKTFEAAFERDLKCARWSVLIHSAYMTANGVRRFRRQIEELIARGVTVCAFLQVPENWHKRMEIPDGPDREDIGKFEAALLLLESMKVHVTLRMECHEKVIVIDECKIWDGSLNSLSYSRKSERYTRWINVDMASDAIKKHRLDECGECQFEGVHLVDQIVVTPATVGKVIASRRKFRRLTQEKLAERTRTNAKTIAYIERGEHVPGFGKLAEIFRGLGGVLVLVPPPVVPAVQRLVRLWFSKRRGR